MFYLFKNKVSTKIWIGIIVFNVDNNKKCFLTVNHHIRLISEGSCDPEDWKPNDADLIVLREFPGEKDFTLFSSQSPWCMSVYCRVYTLYYLNSCFEDTRICPYDQTYNYNSLEAFSSSERMLYNLTNTHSRSD